MTFWSEMSLRDRIHYNKLSRIHDEGQGRLWAAIAAFIQEVWDALKGGNS